MIPVLSQVLLIFFSGAALVNAASSCSATINSLSGMSRLLLVLARHGSHIYRRGRGCQVYHNNAQWFHRASRAKFDFISSDRYHSHDE